MPSGRTSAKTYHNALAPRTTLIPTVTPFIEDIEHFVFYIVFPKTEWQISMATFFLTVYPGLAPCAEVPL
jgi:hypothetical protein